MPTKRGKDIHMQMENQIQEYIGSLSGPKKQEMETLHRTILQIRPEGKLWFLDGKDSKGKIVSNPSIGYGSYIIRYADGKTKEFYQIGSSANTTGISVYIMGIEDRTYLSRTYGKTLGKAKISGYCIKFKTLKEIHINVLEDAIRFGFDNHK